MNIPYSHSYFRTLALFACFSVLLSCTRTEIEPASEYAAPPYKVLESEETIMEHIDAHFFDLNNGVSVGNGGKIIKTTDAGVTWSKKNSGTVENLVGVHFINENTGWAVGSVGTIIKTTDGGNTWTPHVSGTTVNILSVYFIDANNGICGMAGSTANGANMLQTTDGGNTWTWVKKIMKQNRSMNHVFMRSTTSFCMTGTSGVFLTTNDAGVTWDTTMTAGTTTTIVNSTFYDYPNKGYLCGNNGYVIKFDLTTNTFTPVKPTTEETMRGIFFRNSSVGYVVGNFGLIYKTVDGGATWGRITSGVSVNLYYINYPIESIGYVLGAKVALKSK